MAIEDRIEQFAKFFAQQIGSILTVTLAQDGAGHLHRFRKTLLVTVLDCFASVRFGQSQMGNRERFTAFVREYGRWSSGSRISVPFLVTRLEKDEADGELLARARAHLKRFDPEAGNGHALNEIDLQPEELAPLAVTQIEKRAICSVQHWSLLYRYRNVLVHESKEPGFGAEEFADDHGGACYVGYTGEPHFYLTYSVELFRTIAQQGLLGLRAYLTEQELDPYGQLDDTWRW